MMLATSRLLIAVAGLLRPAAALLVAEGSPCAVKCGNVLSNTTDDMIVCEEAAYGLTSQGQVFQSCVTCESTSPYYITEGGQNSSDLQYMLYNMRFATAKCLFESDANPCTTSRACANIKDAIMYGIPGDNITAYGYCGWWSDFELEKCTDCLSATVDGLVLNNFVSMLSGACQYQLEPPATLPYEGNIFSSDVVNVTAPTPTATFVSAGNNLALDNGQIAGVTIGGVVILLTLFGCGVVINGKRRRKAYLNRREQHMKNWPGQQSGGDMFETPVSQRPLRGWEDSPVSAVTQATFPRYFSPYSSQYNSPVTAVEGPSNIAWPVEKAQNIGVALSPDHDESVNHWPEKKGKEKAVANMDPDMGADTDSYELQEGVNSAGGYGFKIPPPPPNPPQAPMLQHPGYGRHGRSVQGNPTWSDENLDGPRYI
ncbi:hypothetical protein F4778DRAFT_6817 [Xylariomycetidae sp. FL2044]|nr:hypothetical protein F4778DRAFT_6817 [Xylariomycetidae sp. FL2044]